MEDKSTYKPKVACNILHLGPYRIRFMTLLIGNVICIPDSLENSQGTPLFLACDLMPDNPNMSRISTKYGKLGMAAKFNLKGFRLDGYARTSTLWFFTIHGLFDLAFSHHLKLLQKECLQRLSNLWMKFYEEEPLPFDSIDVTLEESLMEKIMKPFKLKHIDTMDQDENHSGEGSFSSDKVTENSCTSAQEKINQQVKILNSEGLYDQQSAGDCSVFNEKMMENTSEKAGNLDFRRNKSEKNQKRKEIHGEFCDKCSQKLIRRTCNVNNSENMIGSKNNKKLCSQKYFLIDHSEKEVEDEKETCILCLKNISCKICDADIEMALDKSCCACSKTEHNSSGSCNAKNERSIHKSCSKELSYSNFDFQNIKKNRQPNLCTRMLKCQFCGMVNEYVEHSADVINENSTMMIEEDTACSTLLSWDKMQHLIQEVLHTHLPTGAHLEKCLTILKLLDFHVKSPDEDFGFDLDFLKFCFDKMKDSEFRVDEPESDLQISKNKLKFLTALGTWLGNEFHNCSHVISRRVDNFKQEHIRCIDNLPPSSDIVNHIFPVFMTAFILHWQGFGTPVIGYSESSLALEHNYASKKQIMDEHQAGPNYPLIQLILEFANNSLISGVAHVVFSKIKYTK
ncbi:uncharacterized protein LOC133205685 [Saccostrea echinata]|uniref:uncharacterized protein LOC133205685 n=1 Tax=Saccostrea echinata TaxID=191078 RepID=UPI002A7F901A|nr:uncharacterized protein LOC133205685 [Saccostrea echinata]